jgi:hypothetical protein
MDEHELPVPALIVVRSARQHLRDASATSGRSRPAEGRCSHRRAASCWPLFLPRDRRSARHRRAQAPTGRLLVGCSRTKRRPAGDCGLNRVLTEALAGRRLSRRTTRQLAASLKDGSLACCRRARATWQASRAALMLPPTSWTLKLPHRLDGGPETRRKGRARLD